MRDFRLLVGGDLIRTENQLVVVNPATGARLATCPRADETVLNEAVAAAKTAFKAWAALSWSDRSSRLSALADRMEKKQDDFAELMTLEQGKPLFLARIEACQAIAILRTFAAMRLEDETLCDTDRMRVLQQRSPLGVVAAIVPWNFPLILLMSKLAPALAAGNCVVVKPAPTTPLTTLLLGEICADLLPPGVVNVVVDDNDLGDRLTRHPDIAKIAFTGSTPTGRRVMESAAPGLKHLTLELGGNDAALVLADAPVKETAAALFHAAMVNSGQVCVAIKRAYVHDSLHDEICAELTALAEAAIVDDGLVPGVQFGPLQNKAQFDRVLDLIEDCKRAGKVIAGGSAIDRPGYFVRPTIVRDLPDDARIVREEQFGPVLPVLRYCDVDDAVSRINDSDFGLGASVWGRDIDKALAIASRLEAGTVWINKHLDLQFDIPFRGSKQSGIGAEFGLEGLREYTQARVVNIAKAA